MTKDGAVSVLGSVIVCESYISATARAMTMVGRIEETKRPSKVAGTYVIVRGIGAIDDTTISTRTPTRCRRPSARPRRR